MKTTKILDEVDVLSLEQLEREIKIEDKKISDIENQLNEVRTKKHDTGEMADHNWYRSATSALRLSRFRLVLMNRRRKQLLSDTTNKKYYDDNSDSFSKMFMMVAKRLLKEETYDLLVTHAREEHVLIYGTGSPAPKGVITYNRSK